MVENPRLSGPLRLDTRGIGLYKPRTFRQAVSFKHQSARLAPRWTKLKRCLWQPSVRNVRCMIAASSAVVLC